MLQGDPWSQNAGLWPLGERYGIYNFFPATTTSLLTLLALWLFLLSFRVLWKLRELMSPKFTQLQLAYLKTFQPQPETIKGEIFGGSFFHHSPVAKCRDGHEFVPYYSEISWTGLSWNSPKRWLTPNDHILGYSQISIQQKYYCNSVKKPPFFGSSLTHERHEELSRSQERLLLVMSRVWRTM